MSKTVKRIWNRFTTVLVAVVLILALLLVGARLIGLQVFTVLSGSMEPTYHVGSMIYVKSVDPETIEVGDPITFLINEDLDMATHRVIEIDAENQHFYTKGDANDDVDVGYITDRDVVGIGKAKIPYFGYVTLWMRELFVRK